MWREMAICKCNKHYNIYRQSGQRVVFQDVCPKCGIPQKDFYMGSSNKIGNIWWKPWTWFAKETWDDTCVRPFLRYYGGSEFGN